MTTVTKILLTFAFIIPLKAVYCQDDGVVYGSDDRQVISQSSRIDYRKWARGTAAMVLDREVEAAFDGLLMKLRGSSLVESDYAVCKNEKFAKLRQAVGCSGFFIAEDLLVTAGHCVFSQSDCLDTRWIVDFRYDLFSSGDEFYVDSNNVFSCKELVDHRLTEELDYALIRVDRKVSQDRVLKYRTKGELKKEETLAIVGFPLGMGAVVAPGAIIRDLSDPFGFVANLDAFQTNSGSPVFNETTGLVEGILVSGEDDFTYNEQEDCYDYKVCAEDECIGERSIRMTQLKESIEKALQSGP